MVQYLQFRILEFLFFSKAWLLRRWANIPHNPEAIRELVQLAVWGGRVRRDVAWRSWELETSLRLYIIYIYMNHHESMCLSDNQEQHTHTFFFWCILYIYIYICKTKKRAKNLLLAFTVSIWNSLELWKPGFPRVDAENNTGGCSRATGGAVGRRDGWLGVLPGNHLMFV